MNSLLVPLSVVLALVGVGLIFGDVIYEELVRQARWERHVRTTLGMDVPPAPARMRCLLCPGAPAVDDPVEHSRAVHQGLPPLGIVDNVGGAR